MDLEKCSHGFVIDGRGCAECDMEGYLEAMDEECRERDEKEV